jgi:predicted RNase H-like HicB family nuclease
MTYTVIYEKGPTSWGAYVPDLPGVITVGESREEAERLIQEAIEFPLKGCAKKGFRYPCLPVSRVRSRSTLRPSRMLKKTPEPPLPVVAAR